MPDTLKFNKLHGSRVLIVGGTSGIGYAVAEGALESGASAVILASSNPSRVETAISGLQKSYPDLSSRASITGQACDLSDASMLESNIESLLGFATENGAKPLDHILNTAGSIKGMASLPDTTPENLAQLLTVRFSAPAMVAKHAVAGKYLSPGPSSSITFTSGSTVEKPMPGRACGSGIASSLVGLTRGLAIDLAPLRVNLILPGAVNTELWDHLPAEQKQGSVDSFGKSMLTGKVPGPEVIAESYLYAMKDANLTGVCLSTNGGQLLAWPSA
ncbi:unnamed protein product [Zymoseptoria tritici ST99CH_3D7]|uniref:Ketoreductase (KR) domain-containing protein n=2 Tax=Zymoseptoria tritici TaxID=1047171 RepID=A0A1X7RDQ6_ZYMT9|nr:unnamed protein product [Zymoseptoria tritici ST99CH_3D7]